MRLEFFFSFTVMLLLASSVNAQSIEQLEQLKAQAASAGATSAQSNTRLSAIQLNSNTNLSKASSGAQNLQQYNSDSRNGLTLPGEPTLADVYPLQEKLKNPPFAANLFIGGFESERTDGLNDNYLIAPGDQLNIWLWGAVDYSSVVTVDNQGNIFIPNIGPLALSGSPASSVSSIVTQKIKQVYTNDVNVYVNLLTSTPVSVYLAGAILRPGQYAGQSADSILYFLRRAGGIDFQRGSFRAIDILRKGKVIESVDLYKFSLRGYMPSFSFKDGDTILVKPIGKTVTVSNGARNSFTFELKDTEMIGTALMKYAVPGQFVSHVSFAGIRGEKQIAEYFTLNEFKKQLLKSGDNIEFINDHETTIYKINVVGAFSGPSQYMVKKGTRLHAVLHRIPVDSSLSNYPNLFLLRESVAQKQKEIIDAALQRLERSVYTAPVNSTGEGSIRVQEAQLVSDFVSRAKQIAPLGTVIVSDGKHVANIMLEPNDTIVIPEHSDLIHVGGEVMMPQSIVFNSAAKIEDYIARAGGFAERADEKRIMVMHANGAVDFTTIYGKSSSSNLSPGDQLVVLPSVDLKTLQAVKDITQVIYQIAVAANVALN